MLLHICLVDENECVEYPSVCGTNASCKNTHGLYQCTCKSGYTGRPCTGIVKTISQCYSLFPSEVCPETLYYQACMVGLQTWQDCEGVVKSMQCFLYSKSYVWIRNYSDCSFY